MAKLTHSLAGKLPELKQQDPIARLKEIQAKLKQKCPEVEEPEVEEVVQVSECLSCWDPIPDGKYLCAECDQPLVRTPIED